MAYSLMFQNSGLRFRKSSAQVATAIIERVGEAKKGIELKRGALAELIKSQGDGLTVDRLIRALSAQTPTRPGKDVMKAIRLVNAIKVDEEHLEVFERVRRHLVDDVEETYSLELTFDDVTLLFEPYAPADGEKLRVGHHEIGLRTVAAMDEEPESGLDSFVA
jgi:hypothetical protein